MTQETFVGRADPAKVREIATQLEAAGMISREIPYSIFSYVGKGIAATLYNSGKFVVQGTGAAEFGQRLLGQTVSKKAKPEEEVIGTDESGKGDYFGPLVVAAVYVSAPERVQMRMGEVDDSKKLSDVTIQRVAGALRAKVPHAIVALDPVDYNRRYTQFGNLNPLLAALHAQAILDLAKQVSCRHVLTDQFGNESLIRTALGEKAKEFKLDQRPRAEEDVAVAAASILARDEVLKRMKALSEEIAVDLPLGAGLEVEKAGREVLRLHGKEGLPKVAKIHFKTTQKISNLFS